MAAGAVAAAAAAVFGLLLMLATRDRGQSAGLMDAAALPANAVDSQAAGRPEAAERSRQPESLVVTTSITAADAVLAPPPVSTGRLVIVVSWASSGSPAPGVAVKLSATSQPGGWTFFGGAEGVTDASGRWELDAAPAGDVTATVDRGGRATGRVAEGVTTELHVTIPSGVLVIGVVIGPERQPVAGAEVRASRSTGGEGLVIARSGSDGRFEVRDVRAEDVGADTLWLSASCAGFTPSAQRRVVDDGTGMLDLALRLGPAGGAVEGHVTDSAGQPVAGARVIVGASSTWPPPYRDGPKMDLGPPARCLVTGSDGGFVARDLPAGETSVVAFAAGHSPWSGPLQVEVGLTARLDIELPDSASIEGRVTDEAGAPVPGASVNLGFFERARMYWSESDAHGRYQLSDVPLSEELSIIAAKPGFGEASAVLATSAGVELNWDAHLTLGLRIAGRVEDQQGWPLAGMRVIAWGKRDAWAFSLDSAFREPPEAITNLAGEFELFNCTQGANKLLVLDPATRTTLAEKDDVPAGSRDVVLRVVEDRRRSAFVTGRLATSRGDTPPSAELLLRGMPLRTLDRGRSSASDGSFRIGPVLPGSYALEVAAEGLPELSVGPFELAADGTLDLGLVAIPLPGRIEVRLVLPEGFDASDVVVTARSPLLRFPAVLRTLDGDSSRRRSPALAPGEYEVVADRNFLLPDSATVLVEEGRDAAVTLVLDECAELTVQVDEDSAEPEDGSVRVLDVAGSVVASEAMNWLQRDEQPDESFNLHSFGVPAGLYIVQVLRADTVVAEQRVEVPAGHRVQKRVDIQLE